jgi:hypothetical protein
MSAESGGGMVKKLLAMGCIAAMLLAPVRAQAFEVYSGDQVLQLCAPMDHISRPVCKTYFQGLAEATQEAEQMDICLPNLPIQAIINTTYDELKTVSPQVLKGPMSAGRHIRIIWLKKWPCKK